MPLDTARTNRIVGLLLVAALWLTARPYIGLAHDGIVYLGQALLHIRPEVMSRDLFFAHGSQDQFSLFARVLAQAYQRFDLPLVQMSVMLVCHGTLLAATWQLLKPLDAQRRWLGLGSTAILSHQYGGRAVFAFAERFVTARTLAEPLALLALLALVRGRRGVAALLALACGLVHPLVASGLLIVAWCWLIGHDRRWWWALAAVPAAVALGAAGVAPLDALLAQYDATWWSAVEVVTRHVLVGSWSAVDFTILVLDALILLAAARHGPEPLARLCRAVLLAAAIATGVSFLGADIAKNVLLTQLQLWRVQWIVHLLALGLLPAVLLGAWRLPAHGRTIAMALLMAAVAAYSRWPLSWVFVVWLLMLCGLQARPAVLSAAFTRALAVVAGALLVIVSVAVAHANRELLLQHSGAIGHVEIALLLVTTPLLTLPAAYALLKLAPRRPAVAWLATAGLTGLAVFGALHWDRRTDIVRAVEAGLHQEHPFRAHVPTQAQVLWWGQPAAAWVLLQRASYWSIAQGSGVLFSRETAEGFKSRSQTVEVFDVQAELCRAIAALNPLDTSHQTDCMPSRGAIERVCRTSGGPTHLVFERRLDGAVAQWAVPVVHNAPQTWYLYDCVHFR